MSTIRDPDEVEAAINALRTEDLVRLERAARAWEPFLRRFAPGRGLRDLLSEAVMRTLKGDRSWKSNVSFEQHLAATMRSVANSWKQHTMSRAKAAAAEIQIKPSDEGGSPLASLENFPGVEPDAVEILEEQALEEEIRSQFSEDPHVLEVVAGRILGLKAKEIQETSGLSAKKYDAARNRLRYWLSCRSEETRHVN